MTKRTRLLVALITAAGGGILLAWNFSASQYYVKSRNFPGGERSSAFRTDEKRNARKADGHDLDPKDEINLFSQTIQKGDFKKVASLLEESESSRRFEIFIEILKRNDVKKWDIWSYYDTVSTLITQYGGTNSAFLNNCLFENLSLELNEETFSLFSKMINDEVWSSFAKSISRVDPQKAFFLNCEDDRINSSRHDIFIIEATRAWLDTDSVAASKQVSSMSNGHKRDLASCEMISWLISRNDGNSASTWLALIDDESLRTQASALIVSWETVQNRELSPLPEGLDRDE
jgi:hypothetical protein